jgi:hypothetical protein
MCHVWAKDLSYIDPRRGTSCNLAWLVVKLRWTVTTHYCRCEFMQGRRKGGCICLCVKGGGYRGLWPSPLKANANLNSLRIPSWYVNHQGVHLIFNVRRGLGALWVLSSVVWAIAVISDFYTEHCEQATAWKCLMRRRGRVVMDTEASLSVL